MAKVTAVACDPASAYYQYAGTSGGKVFRTSDAWETTAEQVATPGSEVTAFYIDSVFNHLYYPTTAIIYFGCANGSFYKSTNGGTSFTAKTLGVSGQVERIVSDPSNNLRILVAVGNSVILSKDGGDSWTVVYDFGEQVINDMAWQRLGNSYIYTAMDSAPIVQESSDDGVTFAGATGFSSASSMKSISLSPFGGGSAVALQKDSPDSWYRSSASGWQLSSALVSGNGQCLAYDLSLYQILYAGTSLELGKTMDESTTWGTVKTGINVHDISLGPLDRILDPFILLVYTKNGKLAKYDGRIASWSYVDATSNYAAEWHRGPILIVAPDESAVYLADSWAKIVRMPYNGSLGSFSDWITGLANYGPQVSMCQDPVRGGIRVLDSPFVGGVYQPREFRSLDGLTVEGPVNLSFYYGNFTQPGIDIGVHPASGNILMASRSVVGNNIKKNTTGALGSYSDVAKDKSALWIHPSPTLNRWYTQGPITGLGGNACVSTNDGATWVDLGKPCGDVLLGYYQGFAVDHTSNYIYDIGKIGTDWYFWRSSNGGTTWEDITAYLPHAVWPANEHPIHCDYRGYLYVAYSDDDGYRVFASRDHGTTWKELLGFAAALPAGDRVIEMFGVSQ